VSTPHVAVIGAGIGGLTLALALQQGGVPVDVYEQADELAEIGAGIGLFANAVKPLRGLGVFERLHEDGFEPVDRFYRDGVSGTELGSNALARGSRYERTFGAPYVGVHRRHLQSCLLEAVDKSSLHLGHRLVSLDLVGSRPVLTFANGADAGADVAVGADGARSVVREWIDGAARARYSGTSGFRGVARVSELSLLPRPDASQFWVGEGKHLLHFPIGRDGAYLSFLAAEDQPSAWDASSWRVPTSTDEALQTFRGWHPAVAQVIGAVEHLERWGLFVTDPLTRWSRGPVTVLGDAAHAMLPHLGQGANQTIEDAVVLADLLVSCDVGQIEPALTRYEHKRRSRTQRVQDASWQTNGVLHLGRGAAWDERSGAVARWYENYSWLHGYDVAGDLESSPGTAASPA